MSVRLPPLLAVCLLAACNAEPSSPGVRIDPATPTTLDFLEASLDPESSDPNGDEITYRWSWTVDGDDADVDQPRISPGDTTKGQVWAVSVSSSDGKLISTTATAEVTILNTPPVATGSLNPSAPSTTTAFSASVSTTDDDRDDVTLSYAWSVNGTLTTITADRVEPEDTTKGEVWEVQVTPNDGEEDGETITLSLTVINTAPSVAEAQVQPAIPTRSDTLSCKGTGWADVDGDAPGYETRWLVNGTEVATTDTLPGTELVRGDKVICELTPFDGEDRGDAVPSRETTVGNVAPSLDSVTIAPEGPTEFDTVEVTLGDATDLDGDDIEYAYAWYVNGVLTSDGESLSPTRFVGGDRIEVRVTPSDLFDAGTEVVSNELTAVNNPPVMVGVTLAPADAFTNDVIEATPKAIDHDGDAVSFSYAWYVDGTKLSVTTSTLDGSTDFDRDDEVYVVVTPNDGTVDGAPATSATLTINNTPPSKPAVSFVDYDITDEDDLVCLVETDSVDADGDSVTYSFSWERNGSPFGKPTTTTSTDDTSVGSDRVEGDTWVCYATPNDGTDDGAPGVAFFTTDTGPWTVTTCDATGRTGPSASDCETAYEGELLEYLVEADAGIQTFLVPRTGTYSIEVWGAQGGVSSDSASSFDGGKGARMKGEFDLTGGDVLTIVVGQQGSGSTVTAGGGGGTFVLDETGAALIVAGGGGGVAGDLINTPLGDGCGAVTGEFGTQGSGTSSTPSCAALSSGKTKGGGVSAAGMGSGGAGLTSDGTDDGSGGGGHTVANGADGGKDGGATTAGTGGFGGGGGGYGAAIFPARSGAGGGGGYSGGQGGFVAGAGASFNDGDNPDNTAETNEGAGQVEIELLVE